ncbi:MAG TPA: ATP-binding cassette domain-containing protein [Inquilinus sp.]|nr:ATP-binding cassette domain-containing protein [Inquilinus sp.]
MTRAPVLAVEKLTTRFDLRSGVFGKVTGRVHAVENVSFEIFPGETLALVGESGCGKSTIGRSILQLDRPVSGSIRFEGRETLGQPAREIQALRRQVQMVFQDPFSSLNPRMTVGQAIADPMRVHGGLSRAEVQARVAELLQRVGLTPEHARRHPHAFSGGQRQRICIARALSTRPKLVIADEAVASLDVTIQAQVINLLMDLQAETGISVLFISHDMAVVERMAHRVAVMYLGQIVEIGNRREVFGNPRHSYTRKLLASVPVANPRERPENRLLLADEIPSAVRPADFQPVFLPMQQVSDRHFVRAEA